MKAITFFLLALFCTTAPHRGLAQVRTVQLQKLEKVFVERFHTHYQPGKCGPNITGLLDAARVQGIDVRNARILSIENAGNSVFGMINAEQARSSGPKVNGVSTYGERNWYHHVVLELDCHVLDFDFRNEPTILPLSEYIEQMFLDEDEKPSLPFYYVGRERKLSDYEVSTHRASDYFANPNRPITEEKIRFLDLLKQCPQQF